MKNICSIFIAFLLFSCAGEPEKDDNKAVFTVDSAFAAQQKMNSQLGDKTSADTMRAVALPQVEEGDIIFQNRNDDRGKLMSALTGSKYNNVGMIFMQPNKKILMVATVDDSAHAVPLTDWVSAGEGMHCAVLRMKDAKVYFNEKHLKMLKLEMKKWAGRHYDQYMLWGDEEVYCSELVYKAYHEGLGILLCNTGKFGDLKYYDPLPKKIFYSKYQDGVFPVNEVVVTPDMLYHSTHMDIIYEK